MFSGTDCKTKEIQNSVLSFKVLPLHLLRWKNAIMNLLGLVLFLGGMTHRIVTLGSPFLDRSSLLAAADRHTE